jgi:hypothetical protein
MTVPKAPTAAAAAKLKAEEVVVEYTAVNTILTSDSKGKRVTINGGEDVPVSLAKETLLNLVNKKLIVGKK